MALDRLINPYPVTTFMAHYFEREPLHVKRSDSEYFRDLQDAIDLERIVTEHCASWGEVSLARVETDVAEVGYLQSPPTWPTIEEAFGNGYTIVVNNLQDKSLALGLLCRQFEKFFMCRCNLNSYWTNATSQGLSAHYDDQDAFVIQVSGSKSWRIYEGGDVLPLDDSEYRAPEMVGRRYSAHLLNPGDVLYIPRGFIHDARTSSSQSLHLTLSISTTRWIAFFRRLINLAAMSSVDLRKSIPSSVLRDHRKQAPPEISRIFSCLASDELQQRALDGLRADFVSSLGRSVDERSVESEHVSLESVLVVPADQVIAAARQNDRVVVSFIGGICSLPLELAPIADCLCSKGRVGVRDFPDSLCDDDKIAVGTMLVQRGVCRVPMNTELASTIALND